jgi:hypothetical protein
MSTRYGRFLLAAPLLALASCQLVSGLSSVDLEGHTGGITSGSGGGTPGGPCTDEPITIGTSCDLLYLDSDKIHDNSVCHSNLSNVACEAACQKEGAVDLYCGYTAVAGCQKLPASMDSSCTRDCACPGKHANCFAACESACEDACGSDALCRRVCPGRCVTSCGKAPNSCTDACNHARDPSLEKQCVETKFKECTSPTGTASVVAGCISQCKNGLNLFFCEGTWLENRPGGGCVADLHRLGVKVD